jgi:hypothetical protein
MAQRIAGVQEVLKDLDMNIALNQEAEASAAKMLVGVQREREERKRLIKKQGMYQYDPVGMVIDGIVASYPTFEGSCPTAEGELDEIPEGLPGRIDLRKLEVNPNSPIGRAKRLLMDPAALREFLCEEKAKLNFLPSNRKFLKYLPKLIERGLCNKARRDDKLQGFARFFTVLKKINEFGVPILRTILDCDTANQHFIQPDPVNLAMLQEMLASFANVEGMKSLDLRHFYHQILIGSHFHHHNLCRRRGRRQRVDRDPKGNSYQWMFVLRGLRQHPRRGADGRTHVRVGANHGAPARSRWLERHHQRAGNGYCGREPRRAGLELGSVPQRAAVEPVAEVHREVA